MLLVRLQTEDLDRMFYLGSVLYRKMPDLVAKCSHNLELQQTALRVLFLLSWEIEAYIVSETNLFFTSDLRLPDPADGHLQPGIEGRGLALRLSDYPGRGRHCQGTQAGGQVGDHGLARGLVMSRNVTQSLQPDRLSVASSRSLCSPV